MKRYDDRNADYGHVDAEAEPGEEGSLVRAVVASIGGLVGEEEWGEERTGEEGMGGG